MKKLAVLGSANGDLYVEVNKLPLIGETIQAHAGGELRAGGKGANQAAAASLLGGSTFFLGQVGNDAAGGMLKSELSSRGVNIENINTLSDTPSGQAIIILLTTGDNSIIIIGGANMRWSSLSESIRNTIINCDALLLQREIPDEINIQAARLAKENGKIVIMDTGGKEGELPNELLENVDILSPNTTELERLTGIQNDIVQASEKLFKIGVKHLVVKLGSEGSLYLGSNGRYEQRALSDQELSIVDTTGAGDCFTAALAVKLLERGSLHLEDFAEAMKFASAAAFLSITKKGALESMPNRDAVEAFLTKFQ
ncbi:unnamed protein product [Blepharisma stoltei]|uniref:Ribokinase n=1 Tax=Blepharisma stoltei TaxID=1481888 RepID=A0AAU9KDB3_9CILI|nr:unnamed protein product [Blepharisma stoltei]